jgi:DNA-binding response OmpR family regulator
MSEIDHRQDPRPDRRAVARGGRRAGDRPGRYPHVLVADSYDAARTPCARYLHRFGFQVDEAADGPQALTTINDDPPQVIIVEMGLPRLPAKTLTHWLAQNWRTRHIPVIVLASTGEPEDAPDASGAPAGVLVKPFPLASLLKEIRRVMRAQAETV